MLDPEFRRYLGELYREDDRLRAEREAQRAAPAPETEPDDLLYRTYPNDAPACVADDEMVPPLFDDPEKNELFTETMISVIVELRREADRGHEALNRRISELEGENREIRGMLGATLTILGGQKTERAKSEAEIIDPPAWRKRDAS